MGYRYICEEQSLIIKFYCQLNFSPFARWSLLYLSFAAATFLLHLLATINLMVGHIEFFGEASAAGFTLVRSHCLVHLLSMFLKIGPLRKGDAAVAHMGSFTRVWSQVVEELVWAVEQAVAGVAEFALEDVEEGGGGGVSRGGGMDGGVGGRDRQWVGGCDGDGVRQVLLEEFIDDELVAWGHLLFVFCLVNIKLFAWCYENFAVLLRFG